MRHAHQTDAVLRDEVERGGDARPDRRGGSATRAGGSASGVGEASWRPSAEKSAHPSATATAAIAAPTSQRGVGSLGRPFAPLAERG